MCFQVIGVYVYLIDVMFLCLAIGDRVQSHPPGTLALNSLDYFTCPSNRKEYIIYWQIILVHSEELHLTNCCHV